LTGQSSFAAGPFQVTVISDLRARFTPDHPERPGIRRPLR
jgi:hypothetical protein